MQRPDVFDWTVICDTVHTCQAQAFADNYAMAVLVLRREAGSDAELTITLQRADGGDMEGLVFDEPGPFAEAFTGAMIENTNDFITRLAIADAHIETFIAGLRKATELAGGNDLAISLAGASAALRLIDDVQGRTDTVTALIAKGDKPASAVRPRRPCQSSRRPRPAPTPSRMSRMPPSRPRASPPAEGTMRSSSNPSAPASQMAAKSG